MNTNPYEPELLLQHAGWLRALARSLVGDAQTADDLVQDTWIAALAAPVPQQARPWLGQVLKNFARQRSRAGGRRHSREREVAPGESLPSAAELAARMELQSEMVDLVQGLEQPYRTAIVLRYYEGLSAAEIGRKQGIPGATVRSHIKRGLAELRARLDERHEGGREAWGALLLPWFTPRTGSAIETSSVATTLITGVTVMSSAGKLLAGLALTALALVGYRSWNSQIAGSEPTALLEAPFKEPAPEEDERTAPATELYSSERSEVTPVAAPEAPSAPRQAALVSSLLVTAEVVDRQMKPIAGALLTFPRNGLASEPSDAEGRLSLAAEPGVKANLKLRISCQGFITKTITVNTEGDDPTDLGQVILLPAGHITGTVVDHKGVAIANANLLVIPVGDSGVPVELQRRVGPHAFDSVAKGRTDAEGHFDLGGVPLGGVHVWAGTQGKLWSVSDPETISETSPSSELHLVLHPMLPDEAVTGIVLAPDGSPMGDCSVRADYYSPVAYFVRWATTSMDGRFSFGLDPQVTMDLSVKDPAKSWSRAALKNVPAGEEIILRFETTRQIAVRVQIQPQGLLPTAVVQAIAYSSRSSQNVAVGVQDSDEAELYWLLEPAEPFRLSVKVTGCADYLSELFAQGQMPNPLTVTMVQLPGIHGVVTADGSPVAGARMKLDREMSSIGSSFQLVHHNGFQTNYNPYETLDAETDSEGRFSFAPQSPGDYAIRTQAHGFASAELRLQNYEPGLGAVGLEIQLGQGGRIEGQLTPPQGVEVKGMQVAASRGDLHPRLLRVGEDGAFSFDRLIPGRWNLEAIEEGPAFSITRHVGVKQRPELPWVCEVFEGQTTLHDLDLSNSVHCTIGGALTVDGAPASDWVATLRPLDGPPLRGVDKSKGVTDYQGRFELTVAEARTYLLIFSSPPSDSVLQFVVEIDLVQGYQERNLSVETGSVEIDNVPVAYFSQKPVLIQWKGDDGLASTRRLMPTSDGRCTIERFPSGPFRVFESYDIGSLGDDPPPALLTGRVEPGQLSHFTFPSTGD